MEVYTSKFFAVIVNMGVKNADGTVCYIIGVRKDIRARIGKQAGDRVRVIINIGDPCC